MRTMDTAAAWDVADLEQDRSWTFELDECARRDLLEPLRKAYTPDRSLLDYRREAFDFGSALPVIEAALDEVKHGRGVALVRGLPREGLDEKAFELLTWALGLHAGVARPQGKATQYISAVRDVGTAYRTGTGRGYSSNAELDYHTDSSDIVFLTCYNRAASGGMTIVTSAIAAYEAMASEHPDMLEWLHRPVHFSRQGEEAPDEGASVLQPIFAEQGGKLFSRWNWNRVTSAQKLPGVPQLSDEHWAALKQYDQIVRRPELAYSMWLQPGDVQIVNSHVTLHSRTEFVDHDEPAKKRLLYRLWLAPPDSERLPESWRALYRSVEPGTVRGGIRGHCYDDERRAYEARQARDLGMKMPEEKAFR
ncbi:MAG TPA: TauD/TfdA family dioxygenase [Burkholderiales bacterium]|nr:TauD/TfdA family dioxygenase [Burkholderiales bacterium]